MALVAAVAVLVVAGATLAVARQRDERSGPTAPHHLPSRPFVSIALPSGFRVTGAWRTDTGELARLFGSGPERARIWGQSTDRPGLGAFVRSGTPGEGARYLGQERKVRGHRVFYAEGTTFGRHSLVVANKDQLVYYVSPTLGRSELIRVAERARVTQGQVEVARETLPRGWRLLGSDRPASLHPINVPIGGQASAFSGPGSVVTYRSASGAEFVAVASGEGDVARMHRIRLMLVDAKDTDVRGHPAIAGTLAPTHRRPAPVLRLLTWAERPGELIRVTTYGLEETQLRTIAAGIRPLTDAELDPLLGLTAAGVLDAGLPFVGLPFVGTGRFTSGEQWVLRGHVATKDGALEIKAALDSSAGEGRSTTPGVTTRAGPFLSVASTSGHSSILAYGLLRDDVASVDLMVDGRRMPGTEEVAGFGSKGWVAEVPPRARRVEVIGVDAGGRELGRARVAIPPHPPG